MCTQVDQWTFLSELARWWYILYAEEAQLKQLEQEWESYIYRPHGSLSSATSIP